MQEHEALHRELHDQNKKQSQRIKELVDAGDVKDNRIRELEMKLQQKEGNSVNQISDITRQPLIPEFLTFEKLTPAEAVPKEEFNTLKSSFAELEKKYDALSLEKVQLEDEVQQKSQDLESANRKREELEGKISTLQHDLDEVARDFEILNKELLGKQFSLPFRCNTCLQTGLITYIFWPLQIR